MIFAAADLVILVLAASAVVWAIWVGFTHGR